MMQKKYAGKYAENAAKLTKQKYATKVTGRS